MDESFWRDGRLALAWHVAARQAKYESRGVDASAAIFSLCAVTQAVHRSERDRCCIEQRSIGVRSPAAARSL